MQWKTRRILVLGMTYPAYSGKYQETVCTGGIDAETAELVRIHPVPIRYLEPAQRFRAFQWIEVKTAPHPSDPRPESLRIDPRSIRLHNIIAPDESEVRRHWLESSPHRVESVEELKRRQLHSRTSLGVMRAPHDLSFEIVKSTERERALWNAREAEVSAQKNLFGEKRKPLDFPDLKFFISWTCNDSECTGHRMKLLEWGIHELARKYKTDPFRIDKIHNQMGMLLNTRNKDPYLFLGNFRGVMYNFGLMGAWSARKKIQQELFS